MNPTFWIHSVLLICTCVCYWITYRGFIPGEAWFPLSFLFSSSKGEVLGDFPHHWWWGGNRCWHCASLVEAAILLRFLRWSTLNFCILIVSFLIFKNFFSWVFSSLFVWVFGLHVCKCTLCVWCLQRPQEGTLSPETGVTGGCKLPCEWWELTWVLCRAANALNHWVTSVAPSWILLTNPCCPNWRC